MTRQLPGSALGVQALDAEEHQIGIPRCRHVGRRADANGLVKMNAVEDEPVTFPGVDVHGPSDQRDVGARTREHPAEISAYRAGADDGDAWQSRTHSHPISLRRLRQVNLAAGRALTSEISLLAMGGLHQDACSTSATHPACAVTRRRRIPRRR